MLNTRSLWFSGETTIPLNLQWDQSGCGGSGAPALLLPSGLLGVEVSLQCGCSRMVVSGRSDSIGVQLTPSPGNFLLVLQLPQSTASPHGT